MLLDRSTGTLPATADGSTRTIVLCQQQNGLSDMTQKTQPIWRYRPTPQLDWQTNPTNNSALALNALTTARPPPKIASQLQLTCPVRNTGDWKQFTTIITRIATAPCPTPAHSEFRFELTQAAANHNSAVLAKYDFDLGKAIEANPHSIVSPGSELRPIHHLDQLFAHHPNYARFRSNSIDGIDYPADDIDDETRMRDLKAQLERGNHKSALTPDAEPIVDKLFKQDAELGYLITISKECILKLKHAEVYPLGLQHQLTIDEKGNQIPKKRVTHDLSNQKKRGRSINQRIDENLVPTTMYGHALQRFAHLIHHIRLHHPNQRILMCKSDFEKAYRRLHTNAQIAAKCIATWKTNETSSDDDKDKFIGAILNRLPFGSSPAPAEFSTASEMIFDLASDLIHCPHWDPNALPSPHDKLLPEPDRLPDDIPFGQALDPDVHLPPSQRAGVDGFIDDGAVAVLDSDQNKPLVERARQALGMATHLVFRPVTNDEPIPRPDPQSLRKLKAEGQLKETLIFLGWEFQTRPLLIALPEDKAKAWTRQIIQALNMTSITWDDAKTLVGRLNHVGYIIPSARHFLNRIRKLERISDAHGRAMITTEAREDLFLWIKFLRRARRGISINSIIFRIPTTVTVSDASEHGMGGFDLKSGRAWRYEFTKEERDVFTLNLKEFLAAIITGKLNLPHDPSPFPCLLAIGDSTCSAGWQHKSNFDPDVDPMHAEAAREQARTIMAHDASEYSQHIPGISNVIADSLSRDFNLSNTKLISMLFATNPPLLPPQMKIEPLPPNLISWIGSLARNRPKRKVLPQTPTPSTLAVGVIGWNSRTNADSPTPIWITGAPPKKYSSSELSCTPFDAARLVHDTSAFQGPLVERPSATWQRPLLTVVGMTHRKTPQGRQP